MSRGNEISGHRGEGKPGVGRDFRNTLNLMRGQNRSEFAFRLFCRKRSAAGGCQSDGFKMLEIGFGFIQKIDGPDLGSGML